MNDRETEKQTLLDRINSPEDLKQLSIPQLGELADQIRDYIINAVSDTGGHLASNLGAIEATLAMHYVFNFSKDYLLWDVGHQCYAHKIITGRKDKFSLLRKEGGVSGFPEPSESRYDRFRVGHAGTSIATGLGIGWGLLDQNRDDKVVSFVGDGSIVNGASFEALNNLTGLPRQMLVVLNDNNMSIDVTRGAVAKIFSKIRLNSTYEELNRTAKNIIEHMPLIGKQVEEAVQRLKKAIRMQQSAGQIFESLNLSYFGPVNGHDIGSLIELFTALKDLDHPAVLHIYTNKGKGYKPAGDNPSKYHSTGPFYINGESKKSGKKSYTKIIGETLCEIAAEKQSNITAVTAAMPEGTGLNTFRDHFPDKYYDVGICESAAVDMAAGMAKTGLTPFVCLYSTFLQRAFDQIAHDVAQQNLHVVFCIDRAGVVGDDGPTHHGMLDIGMLRMLPNMILCAPACGEELRLALMYAAQRKAPIAIRYPRDVLPENLSGIESLSSDFITGKSVLVSQGDADIALVCYGAVLTEAVEAAKQLEESGVRCDVVNARFAKPIDEQIVELAREGKTVFCLEDHGTAGGFCSAVLEELSKAGVSSENVFCLAAPDEYIDKASRKTQLERCNVGSEHICREVQARIKDRDLYEKAHT
ncbi:1-deoxy-D-xylulose-5-phosphate synthase [Sedimentisphaera cyanobacteriorum]|uniref:1-deoxy-D-xylulose-5-phosphate synthase n=1 Tax=Sedimentisphaera cyanobacteriorum TaxID=1940790 RepID=A0A1Q2HRV7_9BACT|nr:1-deoxy-D-xylulose-5-phosphate synthase [Sedimentisphaera cyanobacteriorum]AQQ10130.1 1-deoxy-D-xylulose-5-phosphate synthase [Sedimentisphaera cyanobacteriorum]